MFLAELAFIGRELIRQLLAANYCVRAVIHRSGSVLEEIDSDHLEIVRGDMGSKTDLERFMSGIDFVFHLARAHAQTWDDYLQRDVEPTRLIADPCLEFKVKRLIYTGTIASYYTGSERVRSLKKLRLIVQLCDGITIRAQSCCRIYLDGKVPHETAAGSHFSSRDRDRAIRNSVSLGSWHVDKRKFVPGMG